MENLPIDILNREILFRLPIQSLLALKCVNKFFNHHISSKEFINEHVDCSVSSNTYHPATIMVFNNNGFLYLWNKDDDDLAARHIPLPPPFNYKNRLVTVSGICRGLVCLTSMSYPKNSQSIVINPGTGKLICKISQRNSLFDDNKFAGLGLGYDNLKDDYKFIEFAYSVRNQSSKVSVYSLKQNYWKTIDDDEDKFDFDSSIDNSVLVSDYLPHWLYTSVDRKHRSRKKTKKIICLDLQKEKWKSDLKLPDFDDDDNANVDGIELGVLNGCLCLSITKLRGEGMLTRTDVCIMKEYGVHESWMKVASVMDFCHEKLDCIRRVMLPRVMMGAAIDELLVNKWEGTIPILHNNRELGATMSYQIVRSCEWYNIADQTTKILELVIDYADIMVFCFPSLVHPTTTDS